MYDALTFIAQCAAHSGLKLEIAFRKRGGTTTDPSDLRDLWFCKLVTVKGRTIGEWNGFEDREELFQTAARALAETAGTQLVTYDAQITAREQKAAQEVAEEEARGHTAKDLENKANAVLVQELNELREDAADREMDDPDEVDDPGEGSVEEVLGDMVPVSTLEECLEASPNDCGGITASPTEEAQETFAEAVADPILF